MLLAVVIISMRDKLPLLDSVLILLKITFSKNFKWLGKSFGLVAKLPLSTEPPIIINLPLGVLIPL
jgi:hypothetical protein